MSGSRVTFTLDADLVIDSVFPNGASGRGKGPKVC